MRCALLVAVTVTGIACREEPQRVAQVSPPVTDGAPVQDGTVADAAGPDAVGPPRALACLGRHYGGVPTVAPAGWVLVLADGRRLAWDDRRQKTFDETLDAPDLQEMLAIPYVAGPIAPVVTQDHDPGRVRVTALFEATYGATRDAVRAALVPWTFRDHTLLVHRRAEPAFRKVAARLDSALAKDATLAPFFDGMGTFIWRPIAGTNRPSAHSFGISLDLNPARSHYWRTDPKAPWKNSVPQAIVDAFEAEGFAWGGRWFHYDTMHFEWRPELFDPDCH